MCVSTKMTMCKDELLCKCVTLIHINMHLFIFYIILFYYYIIILTIRVKVGNAQLRLAKTQVT